MPFRRTGFKIDKTIRHAIDKFNDFSISFWHQHGDTPFYWNKHKDEFCTRKDVSEDLDIGIHLTQAGVHISYRANMVVEMSAR